VRKSNVENSSVNSGNEGTAYLVKADEGEYLVEKKPLGGEKTDEGVVFKATYRGAIACAFKAIKVAPGEERKIIGPLINEVKLLSLLRHSNLVGIIDYGEARAPKKTRETLDTSSSKDEAISERIFSDRFTYIAMNFVKGERLQDKLSDPGHFKDEKSLQDLLRWLQQISDVITYLHQRGILHMDIKPKNIMIESETGNAVLIDLGDAVIADIERFRRYFKEESAKLTDGDKIRILFDPDYAFEGIKALRGGDVPRNEIQRTLFPRKDLYSFGLVIQQAVDRICSNDIKNLDIKKSEIVKGLKEIALRLKDGYYEALEKKMIGNGQHAPDSPEHVAAYLLNRDILNLNPQNLYSFDVPELSNYGEGRVIQLSDDSVWIPERLLPIIDHPFFQRLRNIIQLDYVHLIYPDAHHSRFAHCLSTCNLTKRAILSLLSDVNFRINVDACDIEGALLYSLLHDIGHYPLSHMFEDITNGKTPYDDPIVNDEQLFRLIIEGGDNTSVGSVIRDKLADHENTKSIAKLIKRYYGESALQAMYSIWTSVRKGKATKPIHRVLAGLISSAIDIDKVCYLSVDSTMSGVNFGKGIDVQAYIRNLEMPLLEADPDNMNNPILAINDKGFAAAESIILARYWMLSRVYWHHANRGLMSAFKFVLYALLEVTDEKLRLSFSQYFRSVFWECEKEAAKYILDRYAELLKDKQGKMINPLEGITEGIRPLYKRFFVIASNLKNGKEEGKTTPSPIYEYLTSPRADEFKVLHAIHKRVSAYLNTKRKDYSFDKIENLMHEESSQNYSLRLGCFLIDIPRKERDRLNLDIVSVLSSEDSTRREPLSSSSLLSRLDAEFLVRVKKCRIFIHPELYKFLEENFLIDGVRDEISKELQQLSAN
jgi:HD superfamily phosphohydrolase